MESQNADDVSLLVVRFDQMIAEMAALALLSLARCDSFEKMMKKPKDDDEDISHAIARLWTEDDAGRNILKPNGGGYMGAAVGIALLTLFEQIPPGKMPTSNDGIVTPACMAHTTLQIALNFLEHFQNQRQGGLAEGPTRKAEG